MQITDLQENSTASPTFFAMTCAQLFIDSPKEEFLDAAENEDFVLSRYPRRFGKTTLLSLYAIHQALLEKKLVVVSPSTIMSVDFAKNLSMMYRGMPPQIQVKVTEGIDGLDFQGRGSIFVTDARSGLRGFKPHVLMYDEVQTCLKVSGGKVTEIQKAYPKAKILMTGTFQESEPITGQMWKQSSNLYTGWRSLPSQEEHQIIMSAYNNQPAALMQNY